MNSEFARAAIELVTPTDPRVERLIEFVDDYTDAFRAAVRPDGGIHFAESIVAKGKKDALRTALSEALGDSQPVAWLDEFGNVFPLAAWAKSEVKEKWRPLYASPQRAEPASVQALRDALQELWDASHMKTHGFNYQRLNAARTRAHAVLAAHPSDQNHSG